MKMSDSVVTELRSVLKQKSLRGARAMEANELSRLKREKIKVRMEIEKVSSQTATAEREAEASLVRSAFLLNSIEDLRKKVDELNAEHVLVEIARLDAVAEAREIEERRTAEAAEFSRKIDLVKSSGRAEREGTEIIEVDWPEPEAAEFPGKIDRNSAGTKNSEANRSELGAAEISGKIGEGAKNFESETKEFFTQIDRIGGGNEILEANLSELEAAKKDQAEMKDEGFRLMSSMDRARAELTQIFREKERLQKSEQNTDLVLRRINSKLVKARAKRDAVIAADQKTRSILGNLSVALQQLGSEADIAEKERENAEEEIGTAREKIQAAELEVESKDRELEDAIEELRMVKASETVALAKLKRLSERTMEIRACAANRKSAITISAYEYRYLKNKAEEAKKLAEIKAEAARAWTEAFRSSAEEISLKIERAKREIAEIQAKETESDLGTTSSRRKSMENGVRLRTKSRRSISYNQSPAAVLKRKKAVPVLSRFLRRNSREEE